jgi:Tol biopolymer transport system component
MLVDAETFEMTTLSLIYGIVQGAAISPDGLSIAYIADNLPTAEGSWPGYALWLVSSAGSDAKPQFDSGPQSYLYPTAWSPDGARIVYFGSCGDPAANGPLCIFDRRTGERWALKIPSFYGGSTTWSPDGQYITATGFVNNEDLCEGGSLSTLEQEACKYDDGHIIYIAASLTNEVRQLISGTAPVWSPDGSMLAFLSKRSGAAEIWTILADGTGLQQLTADGQPKTEDNIIWVKEVQK